jgi:PAS domain S-box-containing protein
MPRRKTSARARQRDIGKVTEPTGFSKPLASVDDQWFREVADYTYDWESWHGPDGRLIWVNRAVERMTGYTIAECLAMADYPTPLVIDADRLRVADSLLAAMQRTTGENLEFGCVRRFGELRWMSLSWQPMYACDGEYLGFRTSVRDVTELRKLRDQLKLHAYHLEQLVQERTERLRQLENRQRQMEKLAALGQLAAGVAHEINNPLAGMRNAFELIKTSLTPQHEHYDLLELVDREIDRISGIVHQMYQLYRRAPQTPTEFDLIKVVREVVYMLETAAAKRQVKVDVDATDTPCVVMLSEGEVKQVLYNLIRNAIQASSTGGAVAVRIEGHRHDVVVHVEDQGAGIPDDVLPNIFDPFFSTKSGESQSGMGLGLSVSRSLVDSMGGRIEVATQPGRGSRFSVVLPRQVAVAQE